MVSTTRHIQVTIDSNSTSQHRYKTIIVNTEKTKVDQQFVNAAVSVSKFHFILNLHTRNK